MFKNLIKGVKNVLKSPIGQIGIGLLLPGAGTFLSGVKGAGTMANLARGIGGFMQSQPMLTQAGLGLLAGDKPQNVLRNVAYGSLARGIGAMGSPEGFMGGVKSGFGMTPTDVPTTAQQYIYDSATGKSIPVESGGYIPKEAGKPGMLESVKNSLINENETDFFKKYSPLLKLGTIGASILAASLGEDEVKMLYDPSQNPYLESGTAETDFYKDINSYYSSIYGMNKGGGVMDFPEKDGMINGPGNGQSDDIPAMLSDGEFVFTKQAVMAAGNGDREQGTKKMYEMMYSLEDKADNMGIDRI
jgi:hypothetical protein